MIDRGHGGNCSFAPQAFYWVAQAFVVPVLPLFRKGSLCIFKCGPYLHIWKQNSKRGKKIWIGQSRVEAKKNAPPFLLWNLCQRVRIWGSTCQSQVPLSSDPKTTFIQRRVNGSADWSHLASSPPSLSSLALRCLPWCPRRSCPLETSCVSDCHCCAWWGKKSKKTNQGAVWAKLVSVKPLQTAGWSEDPCCVYPQSVWDNRRNVPQRLLIQLNSGVWLDTH